MTTDERRVACANPQCDAGVLVGGIPAESERCPSCGTFQDAPDLGGIEDPRYAERLHDWLKRNMPLGAAHPDYNRKVTDS